MAGHTDGKRHRQGTPECDADLAAMLHTDVDALGDPSSAAGPRLTAEYCQAATHDRRVPAAHETEVCDGARRFSVGQRQGKPNPISQFPAPAGDALALLLLGARGQSQQHQSCRCECERLGSRSPSSQAASFNDRMVPVVSTWSYVLHMRSAH